MAALFALAAIAFDGMAAEEFTIVDDAAAYCEVYTEDGGCTNSCKETGKLVYKVTKKDFWNCPQ